MATYYVESATMIGEEVIRIDATKDGVTQSFALNYADATSMTTGDLVTWLDHHWATPNTVPTWLQNTIKTTIS